MTELKITKGSFENALKKLFDFKEIGSIGGE
jgi:hypothetical protein